MERLQKFLAHAGVDSRRKCEQLIAAGRVEVNHKVVTKPGTCIDPAADMVTIDGRRVKPEKKIYLLINKPRGYICSSADPAGRPRVLDLVPHVSQRIYTIGRLDYDTEGLLLLTNDGDFVDRLVHPRENIPKVYEVKVKGAIGHEKLSRLRSQFVIDGRKITPARVEVISRRGDKTQLQMTIFEGRNRQIKRMFEQIGCRVLQLKRIRLGPLELGTLRPGRYRKLLPEEVEYFQ